MAKRATGALRRDFAKESKVRTSVSVAENIAGGVASGVLDGMGIGSMSTGKDAGDPILPAGATGGTALALVGIFMGQRDLAALGSGAAAHGWGDVASQIVSAARSS